MTCFMREHGKSVSLNIPKKSTGYHYVLVVFFSNSHYAYQLISANEKLNVNIKWFFQLPYIYISEGILVLEDWENILTLQWSIKNFLKSILQWNSQKIYDKMNKFDLKWSVEIIKNKRAEIYLSNSNSLTLARIAADACFALSGHLISSYGPSSASSRISSRIFWTFSGLNGLSESNL